MVSVVNQSICNRPISTTTALTDEDRDIKKNNMLTFYTHTKDTLCFMKEYNITFVTLLLWLQIPGYWKIVNEWSNVRIYGSLDTYSSDSRGTMLDEMSRIANYCSL